MKLTEEQIAKLATNYVNKLSAEKAAISWYETMIKKVNAALCSKLAAEIATKDARRQLTEAVLENPGELGSI